MPGHFEVQRRILLVAYRRYLAADYALEAARSAASRWFPEAPARSTALIGNPGSPVRQAYERRERALVRLALARQALKDAQHRIRRSGIRTVYLIEAPRLPAR